MGYIPTTWQDRNVATPRDFVATKGGGGAISSGDTLTMTPNPGTITATGVAPNKSRMDNIDEGIESLYNGDGLYVVTTGSANTYVADFTPDYTTYTTGLTLRVKFNVSNTSTSTINVDGLGVKTIKKISNLGLIDIVQFDIIANGEYTIVYNGTDFVLQNPNSVNDSLAIGEDYKSLISNGSTAEYGYQAKAFYTASDNVVLTSNTERTAQNATSYETKKSFTLNKDGTFKIKGEYKSTASFTPAYLRIYNVTTSAVIGTEITTTSATYVAFDITCTSVSAGDSIAVQIHTIASGSAIAYVQNVTLSADESAHVTEVTLD